MIEKSNPEFQKKQPQFVFVFEEAEINPETNLPFNKEEMCVVDMIWVSYNGTPVDDDGCDMILWGMLEPGEELPI